MPTQMKDGRWRAHKQIGGKRRTKVCRTKAEAKKWEAAQTAQEWAAEDEAKKIRTVSLGEWAVAYLDYSKATHASKTYDGKRLAFRRFFQHVGRHTEANALTKRIAMVVMDRIAREVPGYSANCHRKDLLAAWRWGVDHLGLLEDCPFARAPKAKHDKAPRYIPPLEDVQRVLDVAEAADRIMLLTMLHTGIRRGEVFRLRWDDVDLAAGKLRIGTRKRQGGGMEYDLLPMTTELRQALAEHKANATALYVFPRGNTGRPYRERNRFMARICKKAGVRHFGFHALRHLSASMLDNAGVNLATIQAILRHRRSTTTDHYLRQLQGVKVDLDRVFAPQEPGQVAHKVAHGNFGK